LTNIETALKETQTSVIFEHRQHSHDFDWENVVILDKKVQFDKRIILETICIKKQKKSLHLQLDTELLDPIYVDII